MSKHIEDDPLLLTSPVKAAARGQDRLFGKSTSTPIDLQSAELLQEVCEEVYTPCENQSQEGRRYVLRVRTNRKRGG
eukprot:849164-Prorocentrum_minimum.AAC.2